MSVPIVYIHHCVTGDSFFMMYCLIFPENQAAAVAQEHFAAFVVERNIRYTDFASCLFVSLQVISGFTVVGCMVCEAPALHQLSETCPDADKLSKFSSGCL